MKKQTTKHALVSILRNADGTPKAVQWRDPHQPTRILRKTIAALGLTTEAEVTAWCAIRSEGLRAERQRIALGGDAPTAPRGLQVAIDEHLATFKNQHTRAAKARPLAVFASFIGGRVQTVQDITPVMIVEWRERLSQGDLLDSTRNQQLASISTFLRWCDDRDLLPRLDGKWNKVERALRRIELPAERPSVMQPDVVRALLTSLIAHDAKAKDHQRVAPAVLLMLGTGLRTEEMLRLEWSNVAGRELRLRAAQVKGGKKPREIGLDVSPSVINLLEALPRRGRCVFHGLKHDVFRARITSSVRKFGAPTWSPHALRRVCGSVLATAGLLSPFAMASRQGHTLSVAEKHYLDPVRGLVPGATTIEGALGIADLAAQIIDSVRGARAGVA